MPKEPENLVALYKYIRFLWQLFKLADRLWSPNVVWNLLILALMYWSIFKGTWLF